MPEFTFEPPQTDADWERIAAISAQALSFPRERALPYYDKAGRENTRAVRLRGEIVGGLVLLPLEQYFGGHPVPMAGVGAVAIMPEHRASGAGSALMQAAIGELHQRRVPLSSLYPATQPIYRRCGYERAGVSLEYGLPVRALHVRDRTLDLRAATPSDEAEIIALYEGWAAPQNGMLRRSKFIWERVSHNRKGDTLPYVVTRDGRIEGYVFAMQTQGDWPYELRMSDCVVTTPGAGRRILTFLGEHRAMVDRAHWFGGLCDPLLALLPEPYARVTGREDWMLRIVHVPAALEARGYPADVTAELHLDVRDPLLPQNCGRWLLQVSGGRAQVQAGGEGALSLDVNGLASLYSGFHSPAQLVWAGHAVASDAALASAGALFAGPAPWMRDRF